VGKEERACPLEANPLIQNALFWRAIPDVSGHWSELSVVPVGRSRSVRPRGLHKPVDASDDEDPEVASETEQSTGAAIGGGASSRRARSSARVDVESLASHDLLLVTGSVNLGGTQFAGLTLAGFATGSYMPPGGSLIDLPVSSQRPVELNRH